MKSKSCILAVAAVAAVAAAAVVALTAGRSGVAMPSQEPAAAAKGGIAVQRRGAPVAAGENAARPATAPVRGERPKPQSRRRPAQAAGDALPGMPDDGDGPDDGELSPEDEKLSDAIEKALDDEDLSAARALAGAALSSASAEVRQSMVDALGWFGVKALPELTPFLADGDEDVRASAMNEWSMALSEIDDEVERIGVAELAMGVLTDDEHLDDVSGEYIGVDEKLAVESLLRVIEGDGSRQGIEKAKETYEFVTGDEFSGRAAAERWLAEEYTPPDAD